MNTRNILASLLLAATALGEGVEVATTTSQLVTRTYLLSATPNYTVEPNGTNVVLVSLDFRVVTERKIGTDKWEKLSESTVAYTRAAVEAWPLNYTNNANVVVTNGARTAMLANINRAELFPAHARTIFLVPQSTGP